ncbi:unnamed protein product [Brassica oleracea var. botrytis]
MGFTTWTLIFGSRRSQMWRWFSGESLTVSVMWRLGHLAFCLVCGGIGGCLAGFSDFLVRVTFVSCSSSTSWTVTFVSLSVASYSGDDRGTPSIQSNEENLTFLWSSLMVENGDRFLRIIKTI